MLERSAVAVVWVLTAGLLVTPVVAQPGGSGNGRPQRGGSVPARPVSDSEKREILMEIAAQLRGGYVFEAKGAELATRIERDLDDGRFKDFNRLDLFVAELKPYLYAMSQDKHLRVWGAVAADRAEPELEVDSKPGAGHTLDAAEPALASDGFARFELLEDNIGYIDLRGFSGDPASKASADEAMMALEGADAVILDLRQNGGGAPFMVRYLSAFFFAEPTHLASTMRRGMQKPRERWTLHDGLPTRFFVNTPLYVLTSRGTFSAAESFTFGLKVNHRITQVGERTGGGGHFGSTVRVGDGIEMFLPSGRTYDPATGLGWEAEGLKPDIEVPPEEALEAAVEAIRAG